MKTPEAFVVANANLNLIKCIFRLKGNPIRFIMALSWKRFSANYCIMEDFNNPKLMNWGTFLFVILVKTFVVRKGISGCLEFVLSYKTFSLDIEFCAILKNIRVKSCVLYHNIQFQWDKSRCYVDTLIWWIWSSQVTLRKPWKMYLKYINEMEFWGVLTYRKDKLLLNCIALIH